MKFKRHYYIIKGELNLTPLIDVVFQQLIFFMLTSSFIMQPGIKINLPQAASSEKLEEKKTIVGISKEGAIFYGDTPVDIEQLRQLFRDDMARNKSVALIVKGDKKAEHGRVVAVMDAAREAGINRIAIATTPELR